MPREPFPKLDPIDFQLPPIPKGINNLDELERWKIETIELLLTNVSRTKAGLTKMENWLLDDLRDVRSGEFKKSFSDKNNGKQGN